MVVALVGGRPLVGAGLPKSDTVPSVPVMQATGGDRPSPQPQPHSPYVTVLRKLLGGSISTDTTLGGSIPLHHVMSDVNVVGGAKLTILPGTILKFAPGTSLYVHAGSTLIANGTSSRPIIFTALNDDSVGVVLPPEISRGVPAPGAWRSLGFVGNQGGPPAYGSLTHAVIRYGQHFSIQRSSPVLHDVTSSHMSGDGLYLEAPPANPYVIERLTLTQNERNLNLYNAPSSVTIRDSIIRSAKSIAVNAVVNSAAQLVNNAIENNGGGAAVVVDSTSPIVLRHNSITNNRTAEGLARGVRAACCVTVDARENWWGSTTGPEVEGQSSSGGGGQVGLNVLYEPWLGNQWAGAFKAGDHPWSLKAGVGVDVATGNLFLSETDFSIATVGFPLEVSRSYNNKNAGGMRTDFGDGWMWNYGTRLRPADDYGLVWLRPDGTETYLKRNPDATFSSEEGVYEKLVWDAASGTYRMTRKDQSVLVFSLAGHLASQIDSSGNMTVITRDTSSRVTQVTEPRGRKLTFEYAADGYIYRITDPIGRTFTYSRNPNGALASVVKRDQGGSSFATVNYYYGPGGRWELIRAEDADGNLLDQDYEAATQRVSRQQLNNNSWIYFAYGPTFAFGFDVPGGATVVKDGHGRVHDYRYTASNKVTDHYRQQAIEGGGYEWVHDDQWSYASYLVARHTSVTNVTEVTETTYDWNTGNLTKLVERGGRTTTYTYDAYNNRTSMTDHLGRVTKYEYDGQQHLTAVTDALGRTTRHTYGSYGQIAWTDDALGRMTSFFYDEYGYPRATANARGETTRFTHDVLGRKLTERNPLDEQTSTNYDGRGNPLDVTDPLGNRTSYRYDQKGRKTEVQDAEGRVTRHEYSPERNALTKTIDALGGTIELTYDALGNLASSKDARGNVTSFGYDDMDRKTSETDPLGRTWRYVYLRRDLLANATDAKGDRTVYLYDSSNRIAAVNYADGTSASYAYDGVGNRTTMTDWTGTTSSTYDALDRLVEVKKSGHSIKYAYDAVGNLTALTYPNGKAVTYTYDEVNRLKTVKDWDGRVTSYSNYDAAGRLKIYTYPNGVFAIHHHDAAGRLNYLQYSRQNAILTGFTYLYDRVGNRIERRRLEDGNVDEGFAYDELDRLRDVYYGDSNRRVVYRYDPVGNRTFQQEAQGDNPFVTTFTGSYDAADQLTSAPSWTRAYDQNGAQTLDGPRTFQWNAQHLLSKVSYFETTSFVYDADGHRLQQTHAGVTTDYVVDKSRRISEVLAETTFGATTYFIYGHDLLYSIEPSGPHYLHGDGLGSTLVGTDELGREETRYAYDVFGATRSITGSHLTRRRFTGEESDDTGLIYLRARYYHPVLGRFLSRDPFPANGAHTQLLNRYVYVANNPVTRRDPTGEYAVIDDLVTATAGAVTGVAVRGMTDLVLWRKPQLKSYVAAAVGGFVGGWLSLYVTPVGGGAIGGAVSNIVEQQWKGNAQSFNYESLVSDIMVGTVLAPSGPRIAGITRGQGSFIAVANQMRSKLQAGTVSSITPKTVGKMVVARSTQDIYMTALQGALSELAAALRRLR